MRWRHPTTGGSTHFSFKTIERWRVHQSAPPKTPSPRSQRQGPLDTRALTPASRRSLPPTPSPASTETIHDGAFNSITTISSHSRARTPASGPSPAILTVARFMKEQGLLRARKRRHREQGDGEPVHSARDPFVPRLLTCTAFGTLDFHQGSASPYSLRRDNGKHLSCSAFSTIARASVAISSGISTRPPRLLVHGLSQAFQKRGAATRPSHRQRLGHACRRNGRGPRAPRRGPHVTRRCRIARPSKTENRNRSGDRSKDGSCPSLRGRARASALDLLNTATPSLGRAGIPTKGAL